MIHGIYDNRATNQREIWHEGKIKIKLSKHYVTMHSNRNKVIQPFGTYPDLPKCGSCGARIQDGVLPCDH